MTTPDSSGLLLSARRPAIPGDGPQTTAAVLDSPLATTPDSSALVGRSGRFTFAELERVVNRAAAALAALGVSARDRVAGCLTNDVDIAIAFLATQRLGAIWVGLNRPLAPREKAFILEDAGVKVLLCESETAKALEPHRADLAALESVEIVSRDAPKTGWLGQIAAAPRDPGRPQIEVDPFAPAAIAYTSGTTGFPKGAVHSQHNLMLVATVLNTTESMPPGVHIGVLLPMTILNMFVRGPLAAWMGGRLVVCMDRIDPEGIAAWVREERIGMIDTVPTIIRDLLTHENVTEEDLSSLVNVIIGGADCPPEVAQLYRERFGCDVAIGYGMTEAPTGVARTTGEPQKAPGHCGQPIPQVELCAVDPEDRVLPPGEVGELCVMPATRGDYAGVYTPMLGYWNQPEATQEALRNGRYHTGDLGMIDEQGDVYVRGRCKELIVRGGANVYPAEIERVLQLHAEVELAAVLGVEDERLGERVVAAVTLSPGATVEPEALREHVRDHLARYKIPDQIRVVPEIPRNSMQKLMKRELATLFSDTESAA
jgi:acyl-CoA synthetase (AMP-forming)/AMP-acid ligase II